MQIEVGFLNWIIESKGARFYQILRTPELDARKDLTVNISEESVTISSLTLGRSIFFQTHELLDEFKNQGKLLP